MADDNAMYSEPRSRNSGSGAGSGIATTILFIFIIAVAGGLGWLFLQMQQEQVDTNTRLMKLEQNQSLIKEALKITDENFFDIETERKQRLDKVDNEIRKLWNIANGRNKKAIRTLEEAVGSASNSIKTITDVQAQDQQKMLALAEEVAQIHTTLNRLQTSLVTLVEVQQQMAEKLEQAATNQVLQSLDQRLASLESQRGNQNTRLVRLQEDINLLRSRLLSLENSIQLPTKTIEGAGE